MAQGKSWEWTTERVEAVKRLFRDDMPIAAIGRKIGCGETTVGKMVRKLGLARRRPNPNRSGQESNSLRSAYLSTYLAKDDPGLKAVDPTQSIIAQDAAFQQAMKCAIRMGLEVAPIGVSKDDTPFSPKAFSRALQMSGCSSSAGWAADIGGLGTVYMPSSHRHHGAA